MFLGFHLFRPKTEKDKKPLTILAKSFMVDVRLSSNYASADDRITPNSEVFLLKECH